MSTENTENIEQFDVKVKSKQIIQTPVMLQRIKSVRQKLSDLQITEQDINEAVNWARKQ